MVRDRHGDGHAVLTVKTDKGEFVLDNQNDEILLWSDTGYRFVKRQSQADPNVWVSLGDPRPAPPPRNLALNNRDKELRDPGHVPTPPRPQTGFARGRLSPRRPAAPFLGLHPAPTFRASLGSWASPLLAPFEEPLSYQQHPVLRRLAVLVLVFAVLGFHQQGRAVQSLRRQAESSVSRIPPDREETAFLRQAQCDDN